MSYDNRNKGTIAKNTRKESDNHPDIAGQINVAGVDYWINGWLKTNSQDGSKFYSLSVKPKDARQAAPSRPMPADKASRRVPAFEPPVHPDDQDDSIPF